MSEHSDEGQAPVTPPEPETPAPAGGIEPPRPTVRDRFRRGIFMRLPTDRDSIDGTPGSNDVVGAEEIIGGEPPADLQYAAPEQPEAVSEVETSWPEGEVAYDAAAPELAPEQTGEAWQAEPPDQAWVPEPEQIMPAVEHTEAELQTAQPLAEQGTAPEVYEAPPEGEVEYGYPAEAETGYGYPQEGEEQVVYAEDAQVYYEQAAPEMPQPEPVYERAYESPAEPAYESPVEPVAYETAETAPAYEPVPEAGAEVAEQDAWTFAQQQEAVAAEQASAAPEASAEAETVQPLEDPIAASGLYIPGDVEYLEGDMPTYGDDEKVAPLFKGEGLGEPLFIDFGDLARMITGLRKILPSGTRLTYNFDYQRAWIRATSTVDLPAYAESVRALMWEGEQAAAEEPEAETPAATQAPETAAPGAASAEASAPEQAAPQPPAAEQPSS